MSDGRSIMGLLNPYLDFYRAMPSSFRRDPSVPISAVEMLVPEWLRLKSAIATQFAWAVPTEEAVRSILACSTNVVEIGAGSGYWAWMMRQVGITVAAFDANPPTFTWHEVMPGDERAVLFFPGYALFLCWPPWNSVMAYNALNYHRGRYVLYVGEWCGGSATPHFFKQLASRFDAIEVVGIPQWFGRDDRLMIFRRRSTR